MSEQSGSGGAEGLPEGVDAPNPIPPGTQNQADGDPLGQELDEAEADELEPEGLTPSEKRLLGGLAAAAAVVLVIIVAINVFSGGDPNDTGPAGEPGAAGAVDGPAKDPVIVPTVETMSATSEPVVDVFDRDALEGGALAWTVLGEGDWTVSDGKLLSGSEPEGVSPLAVIEVPEDFGADWAFSITVDKVGMFSGFVWGVEDDKNYWVMRANPAYAVVEIYHVQNGTPTQIKTLAPAGFGSGVRYSIQHEGDTVTVAAGGEPFVSLSDDSLTKPRKVGVIASTDAQAAFKLAEVANIEAAG